MNEYFRNLNRILLVCCMPSIAPLGISTPVLAEPEALRLDCTIPKSADDNLLISPALDSFAICDRTNVHIHDLETGRRLRSSASSIESGQGEVLWHQYSQNGEFIYGGSQHSSCIVRIDTATLSIEEVADTGHWGGVRSLRLFQGDSKLLVSSEGSLELQVVDIATGLAERAIPLRCFFARSIQISPDDRYALVSPFGSADAAYIIEIDSGEIVYRHGSWQDRGMAWLGPGTSFYYFSKAEGVIQIDIERPDQPEVNTVTDEGADSHVIANRRTLAISDSDAGITILTEGGDFQIETPAGIPVSVLYQQSPSGDDAALIQFTNGTRWVVSPSTGEVETHTFPVPHIAHAGSPAYEVDDEMHFVYDRERAISIDVWNLPTGTLALQQVGHAQIVIAANEPPEYSILYSNSGFGLIDPASHAILWQRSIPDSRVLSINLMKSAVCTYQSDGSTRLWSTDTGEELARLYSFTDGSWAVVQPGTGRYDAGREGRSTGSCTGLHWVVNNRVPVELEQLKDLYWDPGLLAKIMGFNDEPLREVPALTGIDLFPEIEIEGRARTWGDVELDEPRVMLTLTDQGGGFGPVEVRVDGKLVASDATPRNAAPVDGVLALDIDLEATGMLRPGAVNTITVRAWDNARTVLSRPVTFTYTPKEEGPSGADTFEIHALCVGVSDYLGDAMDLNYAGADARAFAEAIELAAAGYIGPDRVTVTRLTEEKGDDTPDRLRPTRANILRELDRIAQDAGPDDVVVVFFAGHGVTTTATRTVVSEGIAGQAATETYLFLTPSAGTMSADALSGTNGALVTVTGEEIADRLARSRARKQLLVLDTCGSAGAATDLGATRTVSGAQLRELDRTASRSGVWLLAGCATDAVSYEATRFGQGVLTYTLMEALRGPGLRDERWVEVDRWLGYAADRVPEVARDIGGIQRPQVVQGFTPHERDRADQQQASFAIGLLDGDRRARIPFRATRTVFVHSFVGDASRRNRDTVGVNDALDELLESADLDAETLTFWRADTATGAFSVTGSYEIEGESVRIDAEIQRFDDEDVTTAYIIEPFTLPASPSDTLGERIARSLHDKTLDWLEGLAVEE